MLQLLNQSLLLSSFEVRHIFLVIVDLDTKVTLSKTENNSKNMLQSKEYVKSVESPYEPTIANKHIAHTFVRVTKGVLTDTESRSTHKYKNSFERSSHNFKGYVVTKVNS